MSTELQTATAQTALADPRAGIFANIETFEGAQRMAKLLMSGELVPAQFQKSLADCVIAIDMAARMQIAPLTVMRSLYVVHGKPGWSAAALIGFANQTGRFSPIRYERFGEVGTDERGCIAWVIDASGERIDGPACTIAIAKAEGWYNRNGSKWKTMPELMLAYRAATWLCRLIAPEVGLGLPTRDEIIDITPEAVTVSKFERPASALLGGPHTVTVPPREPGDDTDEPADADFGQDEQEADK